MALDLSKRNYLRSDVIVEYTGINRSEIYDSILI